MHNSLIVTKQFEPENFYNLHTENPHSEMEILPKYENLSQIIAHDYH